MKKEKTVVKDFMGYGFNTCVLEIFFEVGRLGTSARTISDVLCVSEHKVNELFDFLKVRNVIRRRPIRRVRNTYALNFRSPIVRSLDSLFSRIIDQDISMALKDKKLRRI